MYSAQATGQRSGIPQNLMIEKFQKGTWAEDSDGNRRFVVFVLKHKTSNTSLGKLVIDEVMKPFFDRLQVAERLPKVTCTDTRKALQSSMINEPESNQTLVNNLLSHSSGTAKRAYQQSTAEAVNNQDSFLQKRIEKGKESVGNKNTLLASDSETQTSEKTASSDTPTTNSGPSEEENDLNTEEQKLKTIRKELSFLVPPSPRASFPTKDKFNHLINEKFS